MLRPIDQYFLQHDEPTQSCLQFMRNYILKFDSNITEAWKYGMPFYCYNGKMFCYLWVHKQFKQPYLGIVEGKLVDDPELLSEKRARMKILLLNPGRDIPADKIHKLLYRLLTYYKQRNTKK
jgi:hypothetical protein